MWNKQRGWVGVLSLATVAGWSLAATPAWADSFAFEVLVTQTPVGPDNQNSNTWGGVLAYDFTSNSSVAVAATGIDKAALTDPAGLAYSTAVGQLLVGNRTGNNNGSSVINPFDHAYFGSFTAETAISGNSLNGIHQLTFSQSTGELFAANVNGPISRFLLSGSNYVSNGTIGTGATRGVAVSPDGKFLYYTTAGSNINIFDLVNLTSSSFSVTGASSLHYLRFRSPTELYAADFVGDTVFGLTVASNGSLTQTSSLAVGEAISLDFSPDKNEMFVSSHGNTGNGGIISRFSFDSGTSSWTPDGIIDTGDSLGDIIVLPGSPIPEPASMVLLTASGAALLLRRRRA